MTNNQKLSKLCNIRTDLGDDSSHITSINNAIQVVADDFEDLIKSSNVGGVKTKIESLKDPYQSNDFDISNAKYYCQQEINIVCTAINTENNKK